MDKNKYRIIKEGGREYILVSQIPDYAREHFDSRFGIPAYRTIRYYISHGVLNRPEKVGRETFLEIEYVLTFIDILRIFHNRATMSDLRRIMKHAQKSNKFTEVSQVCHRAIGSLRSDEAWKEFIRQLGLIDPMKINIQVINEKFKNDQWPE